MDNFLKLAMTGISIMGATLRIDPNDPDLGHRLAFILAGAYDKELEAAAFYLTSEREPNDREELKTLQAVEVVDRFKSMVRSFVQGIINEEDKQAQLSRLVKHEAVLKELQSHNKPHALGTVDEIAKKYGMSKSEVRRHKAAGTLEQEIKRKTTA